MTSKLGFPIGTDSATFRDKGREVSSLFHDKGAMGQVKNLAKGRDGPGQPKIGMEQPKSGTGRGTKRDRAEKDFLKQEIGILKQENGVLKQDKDVLKQENDVQKQEIWSFV